MTLTFIQFLIICPAVLVAGFIDAIAGGGGLITLPMYLVAGLPTHLALGTNKMGSFMGTGVALIKYSKLGYVPLKESVAGVIFAITGSQFGSRLALLIPDRSFKIMLLFVLPLTAYYVIKSKNFENHKEPLSSKKTLWVIIICAFFIGMYDGFYGPGTGTFLIIALTGIARLNIREANGITKAINFSSNIAALVVFLTSGSVIVSLGLCAGACSIIGNLLGAKYFEKHGAVSVKPLMIIVMIIFYIKIISELFF